MLSTIEPNTKSADVLHSFSGFSNLSNKDFVILGVGTNDSDLYSVFKYICNR